MKKLLFLLDKFDFVCYNNQAFGKPLRRYDENHPRNHEKEKLEKSFKNLLTNLRGYGIIRNTSAIWKRFKKSFLKTFVKPLDKRSGMWYNTEAVRESVTAERIDH